MRRYFRVRSKTLLASGVFLAHAMTFFLIANAAEPPVVGTMIAGARLNEARIRFPASQFVVDVTISPYFAKGDGISDDTDAIQRALSDIMGQHKLLYFPNGVYLISKTLSWSKQNSSGREAWGRNYVQGESTDGTILRLQDRTFTDPEKPQSLMWCGGFGSADWFHNYVQNMTFDAGNDNPGAIGLQFYSNNSGAVRNCRFVAASGSGMIGLDLGHRDTNGPLLVKDCEVIGFRRGISTGNVVNGQTFEHITLRGQSERGFTNEGQAISIRRLLSENAVPAIQTYGTCCLVDSVLVGRDQSRDVPAIINFNGGRIYLRDVTTTGYKRALADVTTPDSGAAFRITGADKPGSEGPTVAEYWSHPASRLFPSTAGSLRLPILEPPIVPHEDPDSWADVDAFGADPTGKRDSSSAIQKAMDSGATTVFLPGTYALKSTVTVRGNVRRILGVGGMIDYSRDVVPDFRVEDGASPTVVFEHFSHVHGGVQMDTARTIVFRSVSDCDLTMTEKAESGELFFEDFVTHDLKLRNQRVWARQLNIENEGTHLINDHSDVWVLGFKTERGGTLLETRSGGRSEILGGFSYTTTAGKLAPMFVNDNSSVFVYFSEVCFNGDPFSVLVREIRENRVELLKAGEGLTTPYVGAPDDQKD